MFTSVENDFIKSFINAYRNAGYKYYICHTITENDNNYDICFVFSENEIRAIDDNTFVVNNGIVVNVDSSQRSNYNYNLSLHSRESVVTYSLTDVYEVDIAEFVYSNAYISYNPVSNIPLIGDITSSEMVNRDMYNFSFITVFMVVCMFIFIFISKIFFRRG